MSMWEKNWKNGENLKAIYFNLITLDSSKKKKKKESKPTPKWASSPLTVSCLNQVFFSKIHFGSGK